MMLAQFSLNRFLTALNLNWSISTILIILFVAAPFLGLLLGESRLKRTTLGAFVGIALALLVTQPLFYALDRWHFSWLTEPRLGLGIFILTIILMNTGPLPKHETSHRLSIRIMILSLLLMTLLISAFLLFLPSGVSQKLVDQSTVVAFLDRTRVIWISAAAIWVIILNLWPNNDKYKK